MAGTGGHSLEPKALPNQPKSPDRCGGRNVCQVPRGASSAEVHRSCKSCRDSRFLPSREPSTSSQDFVNIKVIKWWCPGQMTHLASSSECIEGPSFGRMRSLSFSSYHASSKQSKPGLRPGPSRRHARSTLRCVPRSLRVRQAKALRAKVLRCQKIESV